jgi:protein transport protein SEC31
VRGLEFNVLSPQLLASGGDDGDLYIWDISTPSSVSHYPSLRVRVSLCICKISLLQSLFPLGFQGSLV